MGMVIAVRGKMIQVIDAREREIAVPVICVDKDNSTANMTVGVLFEGGHLEYSNFRVRSALKCWRAMKILEHVDRIDRHILNACMSAASGGDLGEVTRQTLSYASAKPNLWMLLQEILESLPGEKELSGLLHNLHAKKAILDARELLKGIRERLIEVTPIVRRLIEEDFTNRALNEYLEDIVNEEVSPGKSLGAFFERLGEEAVMDGDHNDWKALPPAELDLEVKRFSWLLRGRKGGSNFDLFRFTAEEGFAGVDQIRLGPFSGTEYVLVSARYDFALEIFIVQVRIHKRDQSPNTKEFFLHELQAAVVSPEAPLKGEAALVKGLLT